MSKINSIIASFGGQQYRVCYKDLRIAVAIGVRYQPDYLQMKVIWQEVCSKTGRKPETIARSLARAVDDLWKNGDTGRLITYCKDWKNYQPTPREFVFEVSRQVWFQDAENE